MLEVGWTEILVIAIVLILVVGPKDLPPMLRTFGRMMTKMRGMAGEFRSQFDEALREADLDEVKKAIGDAKKLNPMNTIREAVNPLKQMGNEIKSDLQKTVNGASPPTSTLSKPEAGPVDMDKAADIAGTDKQPPAATPVVASPEAAPAGLVAAEPLKGASVKAAKATSARAKSSAPVKVAPANEVADLPKTKRAPRAAKPKAESAAAKPAARKPSTRKTKKDQA